MSVIEAFGSIVIYWDWYLLLGAVLSGMFCYDVMLNVIHDRELTWYDESLFEIVGPLLGFLVRFIVGIVFWPVPLFRYMYRRLTR